MALFSEGTETTTVGLVVACAPVCPSVSGSTSLLSWGRLSSLPFEVVTAYGWGTPASFYFTSASFHFSVVWSWIVTQTYHGSIFVASASLPVWGQLVCSRRLWWFFLGGLSWIGRRWQFVINGCSSQVQEVYVKVSLGSFRFEKSRFNWKYLALSKTITVLIVWGAC